MLMKKIYIPAAVPEGVSKSGIIFDGDGIDNAAHFKATLLELHHGSVVNARTLRKNQNRRILRIADVFFQSETRKSTYLSLFIFRSIQYYIVFLYIGS